MSKNFLPYDIYERHRRVASFIAPNFSVLDVGGELNHLSQFVRAKKIVVANLNTGDVIIKKDKLPFEDHSFDVVCAIDVLEHIEKTARPQFLKNLINVAKTRIILSFPVASPAHLAHEQQVQQQLAKKGIDVGYLKEHIKFGLPTPLEIKKLTGKYRAEIFFSGNLGLTKILFRLYLFDPKIKFLRRLLYLAKLVFNLIANPVIYLFVANRKYSGQVNRAYVLIDKTI